jgi:hypothetical protein
VFLQAAKDVAREPAGTAPGALPTVSTTIKRGWLGAKWNPISNNMNMYQYINIYIYIIYI